MKKIYCIPYAGESANIYRKMIPYIEKEIEIVPIELAGHGLRQGESFYNSFQEAVDDVSAFICRNYQKTDSVSILGYSLGSLIAYESVLKLEKRIKIEELIVASNDAPSRSIKIPKVYEYSEEELFTFLAELGNMEEQIFNNKRFWKIYSKIIREDFRLLYEYRLKPHLKKVNTDIYVFVGNQDKCYDNIEEWKNNTEGELRIITKSGGHFSILNDIEEFSGNINRIVL